MANPEHLAILKEGVERWNAWREKRERSGPDRSTTILVRAFIPVDLSEARLVGMQFQGANFRGANLKGADLSKKFLDRASFEGADLSRANLYGTILTNVDFRFANLRRAILQKAILGETIFADTDLTGATGLDQCFHYAPCTLDHRTLAKNPDLPESFLRGCGLSDRDIEFAKLYRAGLTNQAITDIGYRIIELRTDPAIQFYSCFLSFSSNDNAFTKRLHDDLQAAGVRCWFAPEDLKIGDKFRSKIDEAIRSHEKLLLILSKAAIDSGWVEYEANRAHSREMKTGETVLFPVRLDDAILEVEATWADFIRDERHIGDFTDETRYEASFQRLLRDLREGQR